MLPKFRNASLVTKVSSFLKDGKAFGHLLRMVLKSDPMFNIIEINAFNVNTQNEIMN